MAEKASVLIIIIIIALVVSIGAIYWFNAKKEINVGELSQGESLKVEENYSYRDEEQKATEEINEIQLDADAAFSAATLVIDNQGNVNYGASALDVGIEEEKDTGKITAEQLEELVDLINNNNFFSFNENYIDENLEDATIYSITVKSGNQIKSVTCYGECPKEIVEIRQKIIELWGKKILEVGV